MQFYNYNLLEPSVSTTTKSTITKSIKIFIYDFGSVFPRRFLLDFTSDMQHPRCICVACCPKQFDISFKIPRYLTF